MTITLTIDGTPRTLSISPRDTMLEVLRRAGRKSVKHGCDTGDCGTCAVLMNGRAVNACMLLAAACDGSSIVTVEGLETDGCLHDLQSASLDSGGVQCGFCTPGMIVVALDLLSRNPHPTDEEIRAGLAGNLCRCTGYVKQIAAVRVASATDGSHD